MHTCCQIGHRRAQWDQASHSGIDNGCSPVAFRTQCTPLRTLEGPPQTEPYLPPLTSACPGAGVNRIRPCFPIICVFKKPVSYPQHWMLRPSCPKTPFSQKQPCSYGLRVFRYSYFSQSYLYCQLAYHACIILHLMSACCLLSPEPEPGVTDGNKKWSQLWRT